jgi:DeoR/GlpR family transcriptional regulator of sugar metabolism
LSGWKRKRKQDKTKPLDLPEDEAIAQYLATPKSIREFNSITDLAKHFNISRMTVHRRTKDLDVLQRVEWLLTHHKLAGDLVVRLHWKRIVAGQVKAAVAGDTKAAKFCKDTAWPEEQPPVDIWKT